MEEEDAAKKELELARKEEEEELQEELEEAAEMDRLQGIGSGPSTWRDKLYYWALQIWDGLGFFGFDDTKLARLKGQKLDFLVKLRSVKWIILNLMTLIIIILVMIMEAGKYGMEKGKSIKLIERDLYSYDVRDSMPLRYVHWFWLDQLFPKIRKFQTDNLNNPEIMQHGEGRLIPLDYPSFNWFDTEYLEWWVCKYSGVFYKE